jgi:hypothetical protein
VNAIAGSDDADRELAALVALARERHGDGLRALILFGSCLSPSLRKPGSIPDLFALVDALPAALAAEAIGPVACAVARALPPVTIAMRAPWRTDTAAKLNLIEPATARAELRAARDLYLAGRFGKQTRSLWTRDAECAREVDELLAAAAERIADTVLDGLPAHCSVDRAVEQCVAISYHAELRPESTARIAATYRAFAAEYHERYRPLLVERASARGLRLDGDALTDDRATEHARADLRRYRVLIARSRLRSAARWPKQALVYRGWFPYLLGKLRRARRT